MQDALIALERLGGDTGFKVGGQVSSFSFHRSDFGGYLPLSDQLKFQHTTGSVLRDHFIDAGSLARTTLGKSPAFEFHEAVDFLAVDVQSFAEAQTTPSAPDAARRFLLVDLLDAGSKGFVDGLGPPLAGLVVSRGTWKADPANNRGNRERFARREELFLYMAHEFASGRVFPRYSRAI